MSNVPGLFSIAPGWHLGGLYSVALAAVGITVLIGVAAMTQQHERTFSASVFYVALGAVGAVALSVLDVPPLDPEGDHVLLERLAELALIVAVFAAGLTIERHVQRRSWVSIGLLLVLVMPLTILAIAVFGMWAMGLSFGAALLLGAVLAPTDPVLAGDVGLTAPGGEVIGEPRLSLHTEAGFNDGLASPFVVLGLFVAEQGGTGWIGQWLAADLLYSAGAGLLLGAAAGFAAAAALTRARDGALVSRELEGFVTLGIVLVIYGVTEAIGAYGLLAVFAAGFSFRRYEFDHEMHRPVHHGAEAAGKTLELLVLLMLGTMLTTAGLSAPGIAGWLLVPLLLLIIRPALVYATVGPKLMSRHARVFLGFFGVRGVAALFYAAVVVDAQVLNAVEQHIVVWTTIVCVVASIVIHGLSATPLTRRWLDGH
ncbi:MAG: cation:proton antiporter [Thermoleophilaceae bacterium]|nr:cation:proton antiporter [Thermoleophilaceae bacterium]